MGYMGDYEERKRLNDQLEALEKRFVRQDSEQSDRDMAEIMATEAGRRVVARICLLGRVFIHGGRAATAENNALKLAYEAGRRDFACELYGKANAVCPDKVLMMFNERNAVEHERRVKREAILTEIKQLSETKED